MVSPVFVKSYDPPEYDKREILRYAGADSGVLEIDAIVEDCIKEVEGKLCFKVCYMELPVKRYEKSLDLTFAVTESNDLAINLKGCDRFVLFAATVGVGIDRLIAKYGSLSPVKALIFQAIGAERIESLCDLFNSEIREKYKFIKPRFSPGYGDFSLEFQRQIFATLDCAKKIGVTLNESLLMSPSKSVTAIVGVANGGVCAKESGCVACCKTDCGFRRDKC